MASARTATRTARAPRPSMTAEEQEENDLFTAQLMSMMGTFEQLAKNPWMQKLLKTKDYKTGSQAETSQQATSRQRQVTEPVERVPTVVTGPVQHVTHAQDPARNGHRSNEQSTHPTIPMHTSFPGYFGVNESESNMSALDENRKSFLDQFNEFSDSLPEELPPERPEDHYIDLVPGPSPPNRPPYRVSAAQQKEIMTQKKDGSWRMCIDYRALNKNTIKNRFPIPRIDDILDRLQVVGIFSRIDLKSGYHQIRIRPEDVHKTAFRTTFGLYEFLVMPFGLTNAPATFNRMMDKIFRSYRKFLGTFFDDMIIFSKDEEEHRDHLTAVFNELKCNRLLINGKKSEFFMEEISLP
ncbi:hypothetical protein L7F22_030776 [Adiantum nelumboides]|nr:hypothetical protein [Adiantum nelumboides]